MANAVSAVLLACAFLSTVVFWAAACAPKGGPFHRRSGRAFARAIYVTAAAGGALAVAGLLAPAWTQTVDTTRSAEALAALRHAGWQTMWLALYVLLIIVAPVQHGLAVIAAESDPARVRSRSHALLNVVCMLGSVALLSATVIWQRWPFLIVMPIGFIVGLRNISYAAKSRSTWMEWQREHLASMLTAGIVLHAALFVFGTSRFLGWQIAGAFQLVLLIGPAVIGLPAIAWLRGRVRAD